MIFLYFCFPIIFFIIVPPKFTFTSGSGENSSWTMDVAQLKKAFLSKGKTQIQISDCFIKGIKNSFTCFKQVKIYL